MGTLKCFFVAFFSFIILDFLWLGFVVNNFNLRQLAEIGRIENEKFSISYGPAILVYAFMALLVVLFVMPKIGPGTSWTLTFLWGAIMGLLVYGVYDFTNLAILKNYPFAFALVDVTWGTFVFGLVSILVKWAQSKL